MNQYIKRIGKIALVVFFSGLAALLCTGTLVLLSGVLFWALDFMFDFLNLPSKFEYDLLSLLRSVFSWLFDDGANFKRTFIILWVIILLVGLKGDWMKKKLAWVKEKVMQRSK